MSRAENQKLTANVKAAGCAAKLSPSQLHAIVAKLPKVHCPELLTSSEHFEDAAVFKVSDELAVIQTVDFFPPVVDDPFLYGRIAAVNAISDVYAMGGRPVLALNVFGFPTCDYDLSVAEQIIAGGAQAAQEAGLVIAGGHSIQTPEPIYGMAVMGFVDPKKILTNGGARAGDKIIVCKPIGTGVGLLSMKGEMLSVQAQESLIASLVRLNRGCLEIASRQHLAAVTDVTGFGLIGHLHEMAHASGLQAVIEAAAVPLLPEVRECAEQGLVPAGAYANRKAYGDVVSFSEHTELALQDLFFDPQTSGGLLLAVPAHCTEVLLTDLKEDGWTARCIGSFQQGAEKGKVEVH